MCAFQEKNVFTSLLGFPYICTESHKKLFIQLYRDNWLARLNEVMNSSSSHSTIHTVLASKSHYDLGAAFLPTSSLCWM